MRGSLVVLILLLFLASGQKIRHVVVMMEENRAFDHMFGYHKGVNGLSGKEWNPTTTLSTDYEKVYVSDTAAQIAKCDPDHSTPATTSKIFGQKAVNEGDFSHPTMIGFVEWQRHLKSPGPDEDCWVMASQPVNAIPVLTFLAEQYALFDNFFSSHPGPTCGGLTETNTWYQGVEGRLFPMETIFDQLEAEGLTWKNYYNDTPWELFLEKFAHNPGNLANLEQFFDDCRTGSLPSFSWVNPRAAVNLTLGLGATDQHPDHDIATGEAYYKAIYEAVRASPLWEETLLIITYDEHGGFYDHVPPPMNVPPPDDLPSYPDKDFKFDRLGVRIPFIAISPWIKQGLIVSDPPAAARPAANSAYTTTSLLPTVRALLGLSNSKPLTARDAWSPSFADIISDELRTDCPLHTPDAPPPLLPPKEEAAQPLTDLQRDIMRMHAALSGLPLRATQQGDAGDYLAAAFALHRNRTLAWRASQAEPWELYSTLRLPAHLKTVGSWKINTARTVDWVVLSTNADGLCLAAASTAAGATLTGTACYPSPDPATNRDATQHFLWAGDNSLRPYADPSMCLTVAALTDLEPSKETLQAQPTLQKCAGLVEQHFAYSGAAPGSTTPIDDHPSGALTIGNAPYVSLYLVEK